MKILLATFYTPGIRAIEYLIQAGFRPDQLHVLTHDMEKNRFLLEFTAGHGIDSQVYPVKSDAALAWIRAIAPDALFSLYFRDIIPATILDIPPLGAVNLHPALLPRYRGTFSAPWVIINGEAYTGFSYHYIEPKVDTGKIVLQQQVEVHPNDTAYSLYHRLLIEGMAAFGQAFQRVVVERYPGKPQVGEPSYFPRKVPFGGFIDPEWSREQIDRFIRALYFPPFKGALARLENGEEREILSIEEYDALVSSGKKIIRVPETTG
jgi:methionyl-tRNA formyltransferase